MITVNIAVLEDAFPALGTPRAWATPAMLAWWEAALNRLQALPAFTNPTLQDQPEQGDATHITLYLCSRETLSALAEDDATLGVHLLSNPDDDPFLDDSATARAHRCLMVSDYAEFQHFTIDEAAQDLYPDQTLLTYVSSYLATAFHEIAHAVLFIENANGLSPQDVETLSDMGVLSHDLFDCSSGYGIRPLLLDGVPTWSDTIEDARADMETYVEAQAFSWMAKTLCPQAFLEATTA